MPPNDFRGRDRSPSGPALRRSVSADVALSEKSPYLGGAWVRQVFGRTRWMPPKDFRGRDRSPSGPAPRRSVSKDVALSEKSPYHGGAWVRLGFWEDSLDIAQ